MKRKRVAPFISISLLCMSGCNFAPKYTQPELDDMPTSWRFESSDASTLCNLKWWEALGDPVLDSLIDTALQNNKDLQVAIWRVREYWGQYEIVRSGLFPQLNAQASALKQRFPIKAGFLDFLPGGGATINPILPDYKGVFNLSYEFDFWGQIRNETFAAYNQYLAQVENRRTVVLTLVAAVAQAYITLRQLDLQLLITQETVESRRESLELAKERFEGGLTSEIEVAQAASTYEETVATLQEYEKLIPQQENLLSVLIGQSPRDIVRGKGVWEWDLPPEIPAGLPSDLLTRRPDILQAENILIAANANIGVARAAFFPQISLTAFYGADSSQLNAFFDKASRTWQIGGSLLQQIFTGGRLFGQLDVAKAQQKEAVYHYEQTILTALKEVNDAMIGHQQSKKIVDTDEADVIARQEYLYLAWLRYYEGEADYLTVLDAERTLFTAQLSLAQAMGDEFITLVDLYKALGGGWIIDADASLPIHREEDRSPTCEAQELEESCNNPTTEESLWNH